MLTLRLSNLSTASMYLFMLIQDGFIVKASSGTVFEDVDLSDDWSEYDEKAKELVSISDLKWKFTVRKEK